MAKFILFELRYPLKCLSSDTIGASSACFGLVWTLTAIVGVTSTSDTLDLRRRIARLAGIARRTSFTGIQQ